MKTVCILGTEYKILMGCDPDAMPDNADGCVDQSTREIKVVKLEADRNSLQNMDEYKKKVLRHEIIHAFFYESGLWNCSGSSEVWGQDETITDWFAIQSPKIFKAFEEAGCL